MDPKNLHRKMSSQQRKAWRWWVFILATVWAQIYNRFSVKVQIIASWIWTAILQSLAINITYCFMSLIFLTQISSEEFSTKNIVVLLILYVAPFSIKMLIIWVVYINSSKRTWFSDLVLGITDSRNLNDVQIWNTKPQFSWVNK